MTTFTPSKPIFASLACAAILAAAPARADIVTKTIGASQDVTLFGGADSTTNNTSSGPGMFVGSDGNAPKRGIIQFDIKDNLPADAVITSANLTLYLGMVASGGPTGMGGDSTPRTIRLFDVTTPWNGSVNGTTGVPGPGFGGQGHGSLPNTGDATWNYAMFNTSAWTTAGGDFTATESADSLISQTINAAYTWSSTQMATDIQNWLTTPASNDGWLLKNDTEAGTIKSFRAFYTKEGAAEQSLSSEAPSLTITFTTATPEPTTLALFAAAAPLLLARRRKISRKEIA